MVHNDLHWNQNGTDNIYLWILSFKKSVWFYNVPPNKIAVTQITDIMEKKPHLQQIL